MQVAVTGTTAATMAQLAVDQGLEVAALVAEDAAAGLRAVLPESAIRTWVTRNDLDRAMQAYLRSQPDATLFLSAAINDYEVSEIRWRHQDGTEQVTPAGPAAGKSTIRGRTR